MPAETPQISSSGRELPIELRVALDVIFARVADPHGLMSVRPVGDASLIAALGFYGTVDGSAERMAFLAVAPEQICTAVSSDKPDSVTVLTAGQLSGALRPIRHEAVALPPALSERTWKALGYRRAASIGIQGVGSIAWASADRVCRRFRLPHVADRCRIAMLRTLVTVPPASRFSTVLVREYRRVA